MINKEGEDVDTHVITGNRSMNSLKTLPEDSENKGKKSLLVVEPLDKLLLF